MNLHDDVVVARFMEDLSVHALYVADGWRRSIDWNTSACRVAFKHVTEKKPLSVILALFPERNFRILP